MPSTNHLPDCIAFSRNCFCWSANAAMTFCCLSFAFRRRSSFSRCSLSRCSSPSHSCLRGHSLSLVSIIDCLHMGSRFAIFLSNCHMKNAPSPILDSLLVDDDEDGAAAKLLLLLPVSLPSNVVFTSGL